MGLFQSKGQQLDATTASNAAQLTNEILESFGKEFAKFYSHCLVNTFDVNKQSLLAKKKLRGRLEEPPSPHCVVKKGTLTKKGLINSSPRSRHFVAYNQKDNYRVDYYESDNGMRKGSIDCCGYYLRLMDKRENELYGPNGLKLVPYDVTRRVWYLAAATSVERDSWARVLTSACLKAANKARSKSDVAASALELAVEATRSKYGYCTKVRLYGTETEIITQFVLELLCTELLRADQVAGNAPLAASVRRSVSAFWTKLQSRIAISDRVIKNECNAHIAEIVLARKAIYERVCAKISSSATTFFKNAREDYLDHLLGAAVLPVTQAFAASVGAFAAEGFHHMSENEKTGKKIRIAVMEGQVDDDCLLNSGTYASSFELLWKFTQNDLSRLDEYLASLTGYDPLRVYDICVSALRLQLYRAIFSLDKAMFLRDTTDPLELLAETLDALREETPAVVMHTIAAVLKDAILVRMREELVTSALSEIEPLQAELARLCSGAVYELEMVSLGGALQDVLGDFADDVIEDMVCRHAEYIDGVFKAMNSQRLMLGNAA